MRKILLSAGIEVDEVRLKSLVAAIKQINIDEVIKTALLTPAPVAAPAAPQTQQAQQEKQAKPAEEEKKEEKKEVSEEELEQGLSALFG